MYCLIFRSNIGFSFISILGEEKQNIIGNHDIIWNSWNQTDTILFIYTFFFRVCLLLTGVFLFNCAYLDIRSQVAIQAFFMTLCNNMDNNPKQKSETETKQVYKESYDCNCKSVIQLHIYVITQSSFKLCEALKNLYLVTLTATSSWVALVRTLNNWLRTVGRKAIITWPSIAWRLWKKAVILSLPWNKGI